MTDFDSWAGTEGDDRPGVKPGELDDGETLTIEIDGQPETFDSDKYGRGFSIPAIYLDADRTFRHTDDDGEEGEEIGEGEPIELVSWSKRLGRAFRRYADENDGYAGTAVVEKDGDGMAVKYEVTAA